MWVIQDNIFSNYRNIHFLSKLFFSLCSFDMHITSRNHARFCDDQVTLSPLSLCPFFRYWMDKALLQMIKSYKLESLQSSIICFKSEILDLDLISCFQSLLWPSHVSAVELTEWSSRAESAVTAAQSVPMVRAAADARWRRTLRTQAATQEQGVGKVTLKLAVAKRPNAPKIHSEQVENEKKL